MYFLCPTSHSLPDNQILLTLLFVSYVVVVVVVVTLTHLAVVISVC